MFEPNPFLGTTRRTPRPTGTEPAYRSQTRRLLARDQRLWDMAEQARTAPADLPRNALHTDLVTRIRLEYLATAAGTVTEWNRSHVQIIADAVNQEAELRRETTWAGSARLARQGYPG
jgi:hypothetical protein